MRSTPLKLKTLGLDYTLEDVKNGALKAGPSRVLVHILKKPPMSEVLIIIEDKVKADMRDCLVLDIGQKVGKKGLGLKVGDIALCLYRPTQKLWDSFVTADDKLVALLPTEMLVGAVWTYT